MRSVTLMDCAGRRRSPATLSGFHRDGPTRGRPYSPSGIRVQPRDTARAAGVRRRFAPHQLRHAHAVEMSREGVPLVVIQRQLGHADLGI